MSGTARVRWVLKYRKDGEYLRGDGLGEHWVASQSLARRFDSVEDAEACRQLWSDSDPHGATGREKIAIVRLTRGGKKGHPPVTDATAGARPPYCACRACRYYDELATAHILGDLLRGMWAAPLPTPVEGYAYVGAEGWDRQCQHCWQRGGGAGAVTCELPKGHPGDIHGWPEGADGASGWPSMCWWSTDCQQVLDPRPKTAPAPAFCKASAKAALEAALCLYGMGGSAADQLGKWSKLLEDVESGAFPGKGWKP